MVDLASLFLKNTQCLAREELTLDLRVVRIGPRAAVGVTITVVLVLQVVSACLFILRNIYIGQIRFR